MKANVYLKQGRLAKALDWARARGLSADDEISYLGEFEHLTLARVLMAEYQSRQARRSFLQAIGLLERLLKGEAWMENRMMLRVEHLRSGEVIGTWYALNEAVVGRGQYLRPVKLAASADGHLLTTYIADGLIAATSTGSTAYALAAGGPILPPELRNILIVPIAPHLSVDRNLK